MDRKRIDEYMYEVLLRDQVDHREADKEKIGTLRGGSCGVMDEAGSVTGTCHRRAHLRSIGIEIEGLDKDKLVMFSGGRANEVVIEELLADYLPEDRSRGERMIKKEEDIPTTWETENGTKVTGRPDVVLGYNRQGVFRPEMMIEAKKISSLWTAKSVLFEGMPKTVHLIQAMHYAWALGEQYNEGVPVPSSLVYVNYDNFAVPDWAGKFFPRMGEELSEYVSYNEKEGKNYGKVKAILPFIKSYELTLDDGRLFVDGEESILDVDSLVRYYEYVSEMSETKDLGPMPATVDAMTGQDLRYTNCSYCPLFETCKKTNEYDEFLDAALELQAGLD